MTLLICHFKKGTDNPSFISNPVLVPHRSVRMRNENNKHNTFTSHKSRRLSICTTEIYLKNYVCHQRMAPGIASYANATKSENEKVYSKQLNFYIVPTLINEILQTVVTHRGFNDITKMNYKTMNVQDLPQGIIDIE